MDDTRDRARRPVLGSVLTTVSMLEKKLLRDNGAISRGDPQLFHELRNCEEEERGKARSARINEKLDAK